MSNIYNNLKKTLGICLDENKLSCYQILSPSKLDDDLKFENQEEGLVSYLLQLKSTNTGYNSESIENIKYSLGIKNLYDERDFFTKLFMRDYESKNNSSYILRDNIDVRDIFNMFASKKLKKNFDFARTIVSLDGKYLRGMSDDIRSNIDIVRIAISSDSSNDVDSFLSATTIATSSTELALAYLERKKKNNKFLSATDTYENILKRNPDGSFVDKVFKDNVQSYWLSSNDFIAGLLNLNSEFVNYVIQGKISLLPSVETPKQAIKK